MKILHVMISPRGEGTPRMVLDWLSIRDHEQELVFLEPHGGLLPEFQATGAWTYVNTSFPLKFVNGFKVMKLIQKISKERKPDLVISWSMGFSQWIHLGAWRSGVRRLIVHAGNPPTSSFFHRYISTYLSFWPGYLIGSKVVCCSNYIVAKFSGIPLLSRQQFVCVYNCFRPNRFMLDGIPRNPRQAIMVATLENHKDHRNLLLAWKSIEDQGLPYILKLAGDGSLRDELKKFAEELGVRQVEFLGNRSDVPQLLNQSKLFVFSTTEQEGFGTVLLEALAAGCLVIASDVPACREALQDGKYGELVAAGDPIKLAEAVVQAFENAIDENKIQEQVRYAAKFTPKKMMDEYISIAATL